MLRAVFSKRFVLQKPATRLVLQRPTVPLNTRFVHSSPKEYNGLQSAAYHFKRQRHMPYFLEYLMWVVFGSEALHLIWLKMDYKEYKEKVTHKTKLLEELISRIENGEEINDSFRQEIKMVLMNDKLKQQEEKEEIDDEYLNKLIASSEQEQEKQQQQTKVTKPLEDSTWMKTKEEDTQKDVKKPFFL